jgi:hypothetical protein
MRDSLFKMFGSVRLVQEVTRSNQSSASSIDSESSHQQRQDPSSIEATATDTSIDTTSKNNRQIDLIDSNNINNASTITIATNNNNDKQIIIDSSSKQKQQQKQQEQQHNMQQQYIHQPTSQQQQQPVFSCRSAAVVQPIPISFNSNNIFFSYKPRDIKNLFTTTTPSNNNTSATPTVKSLPPSRKSSKYTIRHHRNRQSSLSSATTTTTTATTANSTTTTTNRNSKQPPPYKKYFVLEQEEKGRQKSKSQKLLCLWPLPTFTRYIILIAVMISTLNFFNILDLSCSAPSYVIHRFDFKNLILSPFLFDWTLPSLVLFGWNVLILGLFEESLAHMVGGGTRRFTELLISLFSVVSGLRILFGFLFSKSTGWAFPSLFFSNSMHECNQGKSNYYTNKEIYWMCTNLGNIFIILGLAPFLFALLVVQSLSIDDKYILIYGQDEDSNHKITVRKVTLQLIMCLVNYTTKNILWWSVSGLLTGFLITIALQTLLAREKREDAFQVKDANEFITLEKYRRTPLWRLVWSATQKSAMVCFLTLPILMAWNSYYTREFKVTATELNTVSEDRYLFTMVFMTAPRRGDPAYLTRTIESYLENWPEYPTADSPYRRMQAIIYTHFSNHSQYDLAQDYFSHTIKGQRYLKWVREDGEELNQRLHVSKALDYVTETYQSTYYALMEDDFPVCGYREWQEIENVIYKAEKNVPNHCGVFVGTGGR